MNTPDFFDELEPTTRTPQSEESGYRPVAFVHSDIDDYGLDPYEFRVYGHITRRTGGELTGRCFASLAKIAEVCKMSPRKAQQVLKILLKANMIRQETTSTGRTNRYYLTPRQDWVSRKKLDELRKTK